MNDKKVDILLSKADLFKLTFLGFGGVFFIELLNDNPDLIKLFGSLILTAISLVVLIVIWDQAQKLTRNND